MKRSLLMFGALFVLLARSVWAAEPLVFGVVPQQSAAEIHNRWHKLVEHLSRELGREVQLATAPDIPRFEACLASGAYDIAYMNPFHYVVFHDHNGYEAIARREGPLLRGILVVPKDSDVKTREDLHGKKIAFPSMGAFGASVIQRVELRNLGIEFEPHYVKSHASVYLTVSGNYFAAGGGVMRTLRAAPDEVSSQLRVAYTSDGYTPHAFAVRADVPDDVRAALQATLVDASDTAPDAVDPIRTGPLIAATNNEWDDVRALGISLEDAGIETTPVPVDTCRSAGS